MPTTTNNGWPTPADTDLVKNGADAIRDLGNAIDTTLGVYSPVTSGLVKINTTTFSGVSSFSLAADTFTSTYDNYKIVVNLDTFTNQHTITGRMRLAGTDNSTSNYRFGLQIRDFSGNEDWTNSNGGTLWTFSRFLTTYTHYGFSVDVFNPKRAVPTTYTTQGFAYVTVDGSISGSGHLNLSTAFDSMSFIATAGTITGSYSVYGYNK